MKPTYEEARIAVAFLMESGVAEHGQTFKNLEKLAVMSKREEENVIYAIMAGLGMTSQCIYVKLLQNYGRKIAI